MGTEAQLVEEARRGNLLAFEELISRYEKKIYNYCLRMAGNCEDAEDLTQEIFVKVYRGLRSFKGECNFSAWIYRIAHNMCVDNFRKKKATVVSVNSGSDGKRRINLISDAPSPEEQVLHKEKSRMIQQCLVSLKPKYRSVIILRDIQNYSYQEIADILQIPLGTVKTYISRGRAALRKAIEKAIGERI